MTRDTDTFSRATVAFVAVLVVAAGMTAGAVLAAPATSDDPSAVTGADQVQQVEENETAEDNETEVNRTGENVTYTTPAGEAYGVADLTVAETDEEGMLEVSATVDNPNDWLAVQFVELRTDGDVVERMPVALEPNESDQVTFELDTSEWEAGDHVVSVLSHDFGEVTTVTAEEPVDEPTNETTTEEPTTEEPTNETTTEEPTNETTTEEPTNETTTEEPTNETTTEEPTTEEPTTEEPTTEEPTTEEPADGDAEPTLLVRTGDTITYTAPAGEAFGVDDLNISEADEEGMIEVSANVSNPNDWLAVQYIELRVDGDVVERTPIALDPGESKTVLFEVDTSDWEEGDHTVSVLSHDFGEVGVVSGEEPVDEEPVEEPTASINFEDQTSNGTTVVVDEVNLSDGGFVAIHDSASLAEGDATGSVIGVSEYLTPGTHENVTVTLFDVPGADFDVTSLDTDTDLTAMPHLDTNDNMAYDFVSEEGAEDGPYTDNGSAVVDDAFVTIEEEAEEPTASVTFDDQTSNGTAVVIDEVNLSDGGFVAIHDSTSLAEGDALGSNIGVSEYLAPGTHENVTVTLFDVPGADFNATELENDTDLTAMPHLDTNDNSTYDFVSEEGAEDGPYTDNGSAVVDDAFVTIEADDVEPTTEEPTTEEPTTEEPTTEEPTTEEPTTEEPTTEEPTTEEPTTEEPTNETTTTEEPINETTTTEATA